MSVRPLAGACAAAAVLLFAAPIAAQARPADPPGSSRVATEERAPEPASYQPTTVVHDGGVATVTVLAIAGGALLAGAASGFEGGRVATRRSAART